MAITEPRAPELAPEPQRHWLVNARYAARLARPLYEAPVRSTSS